MANLDDVMQACPEAYCCAGELLLGTEAGTVSLGVFGPSGYQSNDAADAQVAAAGATKKGRKAAVSSADLTTGT
jgi:hypothetical protein